MGYSYYFSETCIVGYSYYVFETRNVGYSYYAFETRNVGYSYYVLIPVMWVIHIITRVWVFISILCPYAQFEFIFIFIHTRHLGRNHISILGR